MQGFKGSVRQIDGLDTLKHYVKLHNLSAVAKNGKG
jgi:hypothetical protein